MNNLKQLCVFTLIIVVVISSCKKHANSTDATITTSVELSKRLSSNISSIIDSQLNKLSTSSMDVLSMVSKVKKIEGVQDAYVTNNGTDLIVKQNDGTFVNFYLATTDDSRIYSTSIKKILGSNPIKINQIPKVAGGPMQSFNFRPLGYKAIILAPFQKDFQHDLGNDSAMLAEAGFETKVLRNQEVNLDIFRKDYLADYDVIVIDTHGQANSSSRTGISSTNIATGEILSDSRIKSLSTDEATFVGAHNVPKHTELFLTVNNKFLNATNSKNFNNSFVFLSACQSLKDDDLANYFIAKGAAGCVGYNSDIEFNLGDGILKYFLDQFTQGFVFNIAYSNTNSNAVFNALTINSKVTNSTINIKAFTFKCNRPTEFYIAPDAFSRSFYIHSVFDVQLPSSPFDLWVSNSNLQLGSGLYAKFRFNQSKDLVGMLSSQSINSVQYWDYTSTVPTPLKNPYQIDIYYGYLYNYQGQIIDRSHTSFTTLKY